MVTKNEEPYYSLLGNHTPHDSTAVVNGDRVRAIMAVNASGEAVLSTDNGVEITIYCTQGVVYRIGAINLIKATGTTATNFALFE